MSIEILLIVIALISGFYMACSIGANDVANAVGTAVGAGSLTLKRAVILAGIFEFLGAWLLGHHVTATLQSGLIDSTLLNAGTWTLPIGMISCLLATGVWLQVASYCGWPVSTTHSIVGAVVGFAFASGSFHAIRIKTLMTIAISWVLSPIIGGCIAYLLFLFFRYRIFHARHPLEKLYKIGPWMALFMLCSTAFIALWPHLKTTSFYQSSPRGPIYAMGALAFVAFVVFVALRRWIGSMIVRCREQLAATGEQEFSGTSLSGTSPSGTSSAFDGGGDEVVSADLWRSASQNSHPSAPHSVAARGSAQTVDEETSKTTSNVLDSEATAPRYRVEVGSDELSTRRESALARDHAASNFDRAIAHLEEIKALASDEQLRLIEKKIRQINRLRNQVATPSHALELNFVEAVFSRFQMASACLMALSHGANDVSNAVGPLAAALHAIPAGETLSLSWLLLVGAAGILVGLAVWGWRVIETVGRKITALTPSRGFCAELSCSSTVLICSQLGLPVSTTHTLVGTILGVGIARGLSALNLKTMRDIMLSWIVTIPAGALCGWILFQLLTIPLAG